MHKTLLFALSGLVALSCVPDLEKPSLKVTGARVARLELDQAVVEVNVEVTNNASFPLPADRVVYEGFVEGKRVAQGELKRQLIVPAKGKLPVKLPVALRYAELGDASQAMLNKDEWSWKVTGAVSIDIKPGEEHKGLTISLPFTKEGKLEAPRLPKIRLGRAALDKVTALEATALLDVEIENPNDFALPTSELEAQLSIGEVKLDRVKVRVPRIAKGKKKTITLRQKVRLGSLGAAALTIATGKELDAELNGTLKMGARTIPLTLKLRL